MIALRPRTRTAGLLAAVIAALTPGAVLVPARVSAQTAGQPGTPTTVASEVITWPQGLSPSEAISLLVNGLGGQGAGPVAVPTTVAPKKNGGPAPSTTVAVGQPPVVAAAAGTSAGSGASASSPNNGGVVTITAEARKPHSIAVAARVALGALRAKPNQSGAAFVSALVSSDVVEAAIASADPLPEGDSSLRFRTALARVANAVAADEGISPGELLDAWSKVDERRLTALLAALAQVGTMYRYGGNQPGGFDCSGLTSYAWLVAGVRIPRTSTLQIEGLSARSQSAIVAGDLIWRPGHIGMYVGVRDLMVHSPQTGKPVTVNPWGRVSRFASPV